MPETTRKPLVATRLAALSPVARRLLCRLAPGDPAHVGLSITELGEIVSRRPALATRFAVERAIAEVQVALPRALLSHVARPQSIGRPRRLYALTRRVYPAIRTAFARVSRRCMTAA